PRFRELPVAQRVINAVVAPVAFGALCGWVLGVSEAGYVVLTTLGVAGGLAAGFEHDSAREGALRGVFGGVLFAGSILVVHELIGGDAEATLPDPPALIIAVYGAISTGLGAIGGLLRSRP